MWRCVYTELRAEDFIQGLADNFHQAGQLLPDNFIAAAKEAGFTDESVNVRKRDGKRCFFRSLLGAESSVVTEYDHSYWVRQVRHPSNKLIQFFYSSSKLLGERFIKRAAWQRR